MQHFNSVDELKPGWYAVGMQDFGVEGINWSNAPIYQYIGEKEWVDESGEAVTLIYDPILEMNVSINAADGFMPQ